MTFEDMAAKPLERPLTPKQAAFVREYLIDLNGAQAAIRAGYSAKSADRIAHELLKETPAVASAIQAAMDQRAEKTGLTAEKVLGNIERLAGKAEDMGDIGAALKGNELLGKHLKLFSDRIVIEDDSGLAERMANARKRAAEGAA